MRVLLVHPGPEFSVSDVYDGWAKGLRQNGCEVAEFNLHHRLNFYANAHVKPEGGDTWRKAFDQEAAYRQAAKGIEVAAYEFWPDLVLIVSGFFVPPDVLDVLRSRRHTVAMLHTESPYEDNVQELRAAHCDINLLNDPTNLDLFRQHGHAAYMPHAYDPDRHRPGPAVPELKSDFCFVGTGFPSRQQFLEQVDFDGVDVLLAGNWKAAADSPLADYVLHDIDQGGTSNEMTANLYRSTKVSANLYRQEAHADATADGWAMGPREVELAACGTFFLRESRPESDELFPMLPTFDGPGDFGDKVRWWASHDDQRQQAATRARAAIADRTFKAHAAELLRLAAG